jgi:hypothetical protein
MFKLFEEIKMDEKQEVQINENDIEYFDITKYNPNDPLDKLFIDQEIMVQKHRALSTSLKRAKGPHYEKVSNEIKEIEQNAKTNAANIMYKLEQKRKQTRDSSLGVSNSDMNKRIDEGSLIKEKKRS